MAGSGAQATASPLTSPVASGPLAANSGLFVSDRMQGSNGSLATKKGGWVAGGVAANGNQESEGDAQRTDAVPGGLFGAPVVARW